MVALHQDEVLVSGVGVVDLLAVLGGDEVVVLAGDEEGGDEAPASPGRGEEEERQGVWHQREGRQGQGEEDVLACDPCGVWPSSRSDGCVGRGSA